MLSIEQCRKIEPALAGLPDEEVLAILTDFTALAQLAFDARIVENGGSGLPAKL